MLVEVEENISKLVANIVRVQNSVGKHPLASYSGDILLNLKPMRQEDLSIAVWANFSTVYCSSFYQL